MHRLVLGSLTSALPVPFASSSSAPPPPHPAVPVFPSGLLRVACSCREAPRQQQQQQMAAPYARPVTASAASASLARPSTSQGRAGAAAAYQASQAAAAASAAAAVASGAVSYKLKRFLLRYYPPGQWDEKRRATLLRTGWASSSLCFFVVSDSFAPCGLTLHACVHQV